MQFKDVVAGIENLKEVLPLFWEILNIVFFMQDALVTQNKVSVVQGRRIFFNKFQNDVDVSQAVTFLEIVRAIHLKIKTITTARRTNIQTLEDSAVISGGCSISDLDKNSFVFISW